MRTRLTKTALRTIANTPPLRMSVDGGASYHRWYRARRALGMPTAPKPMTKEQATIHKRDYMRLYMRAWRKNREAGK